MEIVKSDATFDDVHYQLYLLEKICRSNEAIEQGNFHTQDEVERWLSVGIPSNLVWTRISSGAKSPQICMPDISSAAKAGSKGQIAKALCSF